MRPHISNLLIDPLKILGRADQIVQQIPDLFLIEILGDGSSILDLL